MKKCKTKIGFESVPSIQKRWGRGAAQPWGVAAWGGFPRVFPPHFRVSAAGKVAVVRRCSWLGLRRECRV